MESYDIFLNSKDYKSEVLDMPDDVDKWTLDDKFLESLRFGDKFLDQDLGSSLDVDDEMLLSVGDEEEEFEEDGEEYASSVQPSSTLYEIVDSSDIITYSLGELKEEGIEEENLNEEGIEEEFENEEGNCHEEFEEGNGNEEEFEEGEVRGVIMEEEGDSSVPSPTSSSLSLSSEGEFMTTTFPVRSGGGRRTNLEEGLLVSNGNKKYKLVELLGILPPGIQSIQLLQQDESSNEEVVSSSMRVASSPSPVSSSSSSHSSSRKTGGGGSGSSGRRNAHNISREFKEASNSPSSSTNSTTITHASSNCTGELKLSEEERRLLAKEGVSLPSHLPLTKYEERELKRIRRKIRNKISAQDSRRRKKEYLDKLQEKVTLIEEEKAVLGKKVRLLEIANGKLSAQVKRLQTLLVNAAKSSGNSPTTTTSSPPNNTNNQNLTVPAATTLLVLMLSLAIVVLPSMEGSKNNKSIVASGSNGVLSYDESNVSLPGRSRTMLPPQNNLMLVDPLDDVDEPVVKIPRFSYQQLSKMIGTSLPLPPSTPTQQKQQQHKIISMRPNGAIKRHYGAMISSTNVLIDESYD